MLLLPPGPWRSLRHPSGVKRRRDARKRATHETQRKPEDSEQKNQFSRCDASQFLLTPPEYEAFRNGLRSESQPTALSSKKRKAGTNPPVQSVAMFTYVLTKRNTTSGIQPPKPYCSVPIKRTHPMRVLPRRAPHHLPQEPVPDRVARRIPVISPSSGSS